MKWEKGHHVKVGIRLISFIIRSENNLLNFLFRPELSVLSRACSFLIRIKSTPVMSIKSSIVPFTVGTIKLKFL